MRATIPTYLLSAMLASSAAAQIAGQPQSFNGLYAGVSGGYDIQGNDNGSVLQFDRNGSRMFNQAVTTTSGADAFSPGFCGGRAVGPTRLPFGCETDRNRGSYYGRAGYNRQYGPLVFGIQGEFGKTEIKDYTTAFSVTPASYTFERGINWEASALLRAGFVPLHSDGMFYAIGGLGYANIRHRFATTNTSNAFADTGDSRKAGFIIGVGAEKYVAKHISVGVEYSYHDYKDRNYSVRVTQGTAPATNAFVLAPNTAGTTIRRSDDNFRWNSIRALAAYHF